MTERIPVAAIVGRPNVGKSSLFNAFIGRRAAIVDDRPGVTIDRNYALAKLEGGRVWLVDTGGFEPSPSSSLFAKMKAQTELAIEEADVVVFVLDAKDGLMPDDQTVADMLRKAGKKTVFAVNKADNDKIARDAMPEFFALGADYLVWVSAAHAKGIEMLKEKIAAALGFEPASEEEEPAEEPPADAEELESLSESRIERTTKEAMSSPRKVAAIGRPNVGKSTLINKLLGTYRQVVDDTPGTTRDSIDVPFSAGGADYLLIDTAGIRRKARIKDFLERITVMRAIESIERCDVAVLLLDAAEGITEQEAKIAGVAADRGKPLVVCVNKWDKEGRGEKSAEEIKEELERSLYFSAYSQILFISGKTGRGVGELLESINLAFDNSLRKIPTAELNKWLAETTEEYQPPTIRNKRTKFYYASQIGVKPPMFIIKTNTVEPMPKNYQRFIEKSLRARFDFTNSPVRIFFRRK